MKRLPDGLRKVSKDEFSKELLEFQEEKGIPFYSENKKYMEWSKKEEKKEFKTTFRW